MSTKLIINADDCGRTTFVNSRIEEFIKLGKISSTTIMAQMDDFDGAVRLYNAYKDTISFGVHLNLTEGEPMLYNQEMLDKGLYQEVDGKILFNTQWSRNKFQSSRIRKAIFDEFCTQITKIKDSGVEISHIDSHSHIHTTLLNLFVTPKVAKQFGIVKMRRLNNYRKFDLSFIGRQTWAKIIKAQNRNIQFTDYFADYGCVYDDAQNQRFKDGVIEIMCHPGGLYPDEEELILRTDIEKMYNNATLVNYNQI